MKNSILLQSNEQTSLQTQLRVLGVLTFVLSLFLTITILSFTQSDIQNGSVPFKALFGFIEDIDDFRAKVEISQNKLGLPGSYIATYCVHKTIGYWSLVLSFLLAACTWEVFVNGFLGYNFFRRSFWILLLAVSLSVLSSILQSTILPTLPIEFTGSLSNLLAKSLLLGIGKLGAYLFVGVVIVASVANIFTYGLSGLYLSTRKKQEPTIPDDVLRAQARYYVDIYSEDEEPIEVLRSTVDVAEDIDNQSEIKEEIENTLSIEELPSALVPLDEVEEFDDYSESQDMLQPVEVLESIEEFSLQPEEISQTESVPYEDFNVTTPTIIGSVPVEIYDEETIESPISEQNSFTEEYDSPITKNIQEETETEPSIESESLEIVQETVEIVNDSNQEIQEQGIDEELSSNEIETIEEIQTSDNTQPSIDSYPESMVISPIEEESIDTPITFESIDSLTEEPSNQTIFMPQLGETILPDFDEIGDIELDEAMVESVMEEFPVEVETDEESISAKPVLEENSEIDSTPEDISQNTQSSINELPFEFATPSTTSSKEQSTRTKYLVDFSQESQQSNTSLLRAKLETLHIPFSSIEEQDTLLTTKYSLFFTKSFDQIQAQAMHSEVIEALKAPGVVIESHLSTNNSIVVEIPKKNLQEIISAIKIVQPNTKGILPIDFGYKNNGDIIRLDVTECYNILIGGANGTGKTNLLVSMIHSLSKNNDAVSLKYLPIILNTHPYSSVEPIFKHSFTVVEGDEQRTIHSTEIHALQAIKALFFETKKRLELFDAERKTTISAYNYLKNPLEQLPYIVTIIDPIEMISAHKESRDYLSVILLCGSAVGIHVLVQLKNVPSIDTLLLQRFPCTIASFTNSKTSSRLLLKSTSAEGLLSSNDFILNSSTFSQNSYFRFFMSSEPKYASSVQNLKPDSYPYHLPKIEHKEQKSSKNIDPMLLKIAEFVVKEQKALIGSILHKFNLSFEDTVAYITQLEKAGILSQYNQKNRTVLVKDISDLPRYL